MLRKIIVQVVQKISTNSMVNFLVQVILSFLLVWMKTMVKLLLMQKNICKNIIVKSSLPSINKHFIKSRVRRSFRHKNIISRAG
jgi:hypothetical protein